MEEIKKIIIIICGLLLLVIVSAAFFLNVYLEQQDKQKENSIVANQQDIRIVINLYSRRLLVYKDDQIWKNYPIAIGKPTTKSPVGEWAIINKSKSWGGGFGTRWLGLNVPWGSYGIHGTNKPWSIGSAASHGCIRLHNQHVEELFEIIPVKTRVKIIGTRLPIDVAKPLKSGQMGLEVMQLQENLRDRGYRIDYLDGRYGDSTVQAVQELEKQYGLYPDGRADENVLYLLGLPEGVKK